MHRGTDWLEGGEGHRVGGLSWLEAGGEGVALTKFTLRGALEICKKHALDFFNSEIEKRKYKIVDTVDII